MSALDLALVPTLPLANMGLPMLYLLYPAFLAALVPVVAVEGFVLKLRLRGGWSWKAAMGTSLLGNVLSTIIGIPVTWCLLMVIEVLGTFALQSIESTAGKVLAVTLGAPWLYPWVDRPEWMIPAASTFLLLPFFLSSSWMETWVARRVLHGQEPSRVRTAVFLANAISYSGLLVLNLWWLKNTLSTGRADLFYP